ncbi:MAG: hypothetical protein HGA25_02960 [Clostridiales bacterium]|nr:hypothetical protein [Clostridiales bacterium]
MKKITKKISLFLSALLVFTMVSSADAMTLSSQASFYQNTQMNQNAQRFGQNMGPKTNRTQNQTCMQPAPEKNQVQEMLQAPEVPNGTSITEQVPSIDRQLQKEILAEETGEGAVSTYDYVDVMGNVSQEDYDTFAYYLEMADDNLAEDFAEEGWTIILTSADLDSLLFGGRTDGVMGCTYYGKETIYVQTGDYSYCVIHELGHYLDYYYDFISTATDFVTIYNEEAASLSEYGQTCSEEFFAEVYSYSILEPDTTAQSCPDAYEYVNSLADAVE